MLLLVLVCFAPFQWQCAVCVGLISGSPTYIAPGNSPPSAPVRPSMLQNSTKLDNRGCRICTDKHVFVFSNGAVSACGGGAGLLQREDAALRTPGALREHAGETAPAQEREGALPCGSAWERRSATVVACMSTPPAFLVLAVWSSLV